MIVYCDTNFLISFLNEEDANHKAAQNMVARWNPEDFVVCALHLVEFPAGVRAATHRQKHPIQPHVARGLINRFDRAVNGGLFIRRELPISDSVNMARSLGEAHGWKKRHNSFDLCIWARRGRFPPGPFSLLTSGNPRWPRRSAWPSFE